MMRKPNRGRATTHSLRIVGGQWRRRQLPVLDSPGLRPTPDRVRETLFNWLAPVMDGLHCLDAFAGSGVLGLEAVSRGAASALLLERDAALAHNLREQVANLDADAVTVVQDDALRWLREAPVQAFGLVFLDPPYRAGLLQPALDALLARDWLCAAAFVYLEFAEDEPPPVLGAGWERWRETRAGQVQAWLLRRH